MRLGVSGVVLLVAACRPLVSPVDSCADDLGGVWEAADGRRFHLVERPGGKLEVYPLFDPTGPDKQAPPHRTPGKTELERVGPSLVGRTTSQATPREGGRACTIVTPARLEGCAGDRARLIVELAPAVDVAACAATSGEPPAVEIRRN